MYNKEEVMRDIFQSEPMQRLMNAEATLMATGRLGSYKGKQTTTEVFSTALDAAYKAGKETRIEHCAEPECPECNITAYKAGVEDCIAIVEECSDFADSGHTLKMRIINQIQALK